MKHHVDFYGFFEDYDEEQKKLDYHSQIDDDTDEDEEKPASIIEEVCSMSRAFVLAIKVKLLAKANLIGFIGRL